MYQRAALSQQEADTFSVQCQVNDRRAAGGGGATDVLAACSTVSTMDGSAVQQR